MDQQQWYVWCKDVADRLGKIEKSLLAYHKLQKRMLYVIMIGFTAVLGNGLLLYYS